MPTPAWINGPFAAMRARVVLHFRNSPGLNATPANVLARLNIELPNGTLDQYAYLDAQAAALAHDINEARGQARQPERDRRIRLPAAQILTLRQRIRDTFENNVVDSQLRDGLRRCITFSHPTVIDDLAYPELFWEEMVAYIRSVLIGEHGMHINDFARWIFDAGDATINLGVFRPSDIDADYLAEIFMRLFQSERNRDNPPTLWDLTVTVCFFPAGQHNLVPPAGRGIKALPFALRSYKNKLQVLDDEGGRCLFKCLVLGMDDVWKKEGGAEKSQLGRPIMAKTLLKKARELQQELMLDDEVSDCYWPDLDRFIEVYTNWRVAVVSPSGGLVNQGIWKGEDFTLPNEESTSYGRSIFICYFDNHFYRIPNSRFARFGATNTSNDSHTKRCRQCLSYVREKSFNKHCCDGRYHCNRCDTWMDAHAEKDSHTHGLETNDWKCGNCSAKCGSEMCREKHYQQCKEKNPQEHCYRCKQAYTPEDYLDDGTLHHEGNPLRCKPYRCKNNACKGLTFTFEELKLHRDYIAPLVNRPKRRRDAEEFEEDEMQHHWAWDIETLSYDKTIMVGSPRHEMVVKEQRVHLIIACSLGGDHAEPVSYYSVKDFLENSTLLANGEKHTYWAHNGAKFDTRFIYDWVRLNDSAAFEISKAPILMGNKIMEFTYRNLTFRDSILHMTMALSKLPATFGISETDIGVELKKGMFPYAFMRPENLHYEGELPALHYYEPQKKYKRDKFKPVEDDRTGLEEWHAKESALIRERIAAGGPGWNYLHEEYEYCKMDVLILREALLEWQRVNVEEGNCDPLKSLTLAAHCHKTLRTHHLLYNEIPILRARPDLARFDPVLDEEGVARIAYSGGNTNLRRTLIELDDIEMQLGHKIVMYDFRSQYPYCMVGDNHPFPVGDYTAEFFTLDNQPTEEYLSTLEGLISCEIYYPSDEPPLFHPILPSRQNDKLTFSLEGPELTLEDIRHFQSGTCANLECRACITSQKRSVKPVVYTMPEIKAALANGYRMSYVYWVIKSERSSTTLFKSYVAKNYGLKAKNSKAPDYNWDDPAKVEEYIRRHAEIGIEVKPAAGSTDIRTWHHVSEGLKQLGKLMANSGYGKFGERGYRTETIITTSRYEEEEINRREAAQEIRVTSLTFGDGYGEYQIKNNDAGDTLFTTNVVIAAYVTAYGRLLLWELCNRYGKQVLYHDTDSAVIHLRPEDKPPTDLIGVFLGDLDIEIPNAHAFVSTGPKSYAIKFWDNAKPEHYRSLGHTQEELLSDLDLRHRVLVQEYDDGDVYRWHNDTLQVEHIKQRSKGIVLTEENSRKLNYESMKIMTQVMCGELDEELNSMELDSIEFVWRRDAALFYITNGTKTVTADKNHLKGQLYGRYLMPWGWNRWTPEQWGLN